MNPGTGAWSRVVTGFAGPTDVLRDPAGRLLISDHAGSAIYALMPPGTVGVVADAGGRSGDGVIRVLKVSPQPARGEVRLDIVLSRATRLELEAFDVHGARLGRRDLGPRSAGVHRVTWAPSARSIAGPTPGLVFLRLLADGGEIATARVVFTP